MCFYTIILLFRQTLFPELLIKVFRSIKVGTKSVLQSYTLQTPEKCSLNVMYAKKRLSVRILFQIPPWSLETIKVIVEGTEAQGKERSFMNYKGVCTKYGLEPKTLDRWPI